MNNQTKDLILEMEGFEVFANIIISQHKEMWEARKSYIKEMYKILIHSGKFNRSQAVDQIYNTLANKLDSLIEVRKTVIENVTKGVK